MTRALLLLPLLAACGRGPEERPPYRGESVLAFQGGAPNNLLFLSIDTLRRDHLGAYGARGVTPFLDRVADEGFVVDDVQQCSAWTLPGITCALAGSSNLERAWTPGLDGSPGKPVEPVEEPLLADWLGDAGFWTGLVSGNLWFSPEYGNGSGYQDYVRNGASAAAVGEEGLKLLKKGPDPEQRWFLHLHHMEPHWPYLPQERFIEAGGLQPWPEDLLDRDVQDAARDSWEDLGASDRELLEAHMRVLYEAEVRMLDARLAETWDTLDRGGWLDDTLVVIWTDHGEQIWEHGWKGHAHGLHADENDAAMIFWARDIEPGRYRGPVSAIDLTPTALDVMGVDIPAAVTGAILGTEAPDRARFTEVMAYGGILQAVTVEDRKLIYKWDGSVELFDRSTDRAENEDLFVPGDETAAALWAELAPKVEQLDGLLPSRNPTAPTL